MKKYIILILISIFCYTTYAAQVDTTSVDTTSLTFKTVYNDVKSGIAGLSESLKIGVEHVYEVLVKQSVVNAITWLILSLVFLILCLIFTKRCFTLLAHLEDKEHLWYKDTIYEHGSIRFSLIVAVSMGVLFLCVFCGSISEILMGFVNPEYGAIKTILNIVR